MLREQRWRSETQSESEREREREGGGREDTERNRAYDWRLEGWNGKSKRETSTMRGVSGISKFERENISFTQNLPLGRKGCIRGIVWLFFAVHPEARVEYTSAASIIDDYAPVGKKRRVHTYGCSRASAAIVTSDFSALEVAIVVAAYQHACRRVSGLREYAPWFVCRWLLASVVSCRALGSFARQRLIFFVSAAIVREMIRR